MPLSRGLPKLAKVKLRTDRRSRRWWPILVAVGLIGAASQSMSTAQAAGVPEGAVSGNAQTGRIGPGRLVEVPTSDVPFLPNRDQLAARELALTSHLAPALGSRAMAQASGSGGPQTDGSVKQAPNDFTIFKKSIIHAPTCVGCGLSSINEPSAANSGTHVVETSNWDLAYSNNGGATFLHLNPYAFSSGFCCDQQVVYNADRDVFILLQLDFAGEGNANNGLALSVARGTTPTSWCTYKFSGAIGGGATDTPDFPKIAVSNNDVIITWNDYPPFSGFSQSGLARMPLDAIAACAGFNYSFVAYLLVGRQQRDLLLGHKRHQRVHLRNRRMRLTKLVLSTGPEVRIGGDHACRVPGAGQRGIRGRPDSRGRGNGGSERIQQWQQLRRVQLLPVEFTLLHR
jgi:hypothetical protein